MMTPQAKNPTASSTRDILKSIDDDSNEKEYGPKISDPLVQRVEGKMADKVNIRESQGEIPESSNT